VVLWCKKQVIVVVWYCGGVVAQDNRSGDVATWYCGGTKSAYTN
jgi:hypothetical protein